MYIRRTTCLEDKSTQVSASSVRQSLFPDRPIPLKKRIQTTTAKFRRLLWKASDFFWRACKCLLTYLMMMPCRIMLVDPNILRNRERAIWFTYLMILGVVPFSFLAGLCFAKLSSNVISDNHNNYPDSASTAFNLDHPENNETPFENQYAGDPELIDQNFITNFESDVLEHVTTDEITNELMQTGIINDSVKESIDKLLKDQKYFELQENLRIRVEEQEEIINGLIVELRKMRTTLESLQNDQSNTDNSKIHRQSTSTIESLLNNPNSLNKQESFKNWLHSLFVTKNDMEMRFKIYDADKTGLVDYAMESLGGKIVRSCCTKVFTSKPLLNVFGIPICYLRTPPNSVIQSDNLPGSCWAFEGFPGILVIKLTHLIHIELFSIEHTNRFQIPDGDINSAPREFVVYGLTDLTDSDSIPIAEFEYDINGEPLQFFKADETDKVFQYIEVQINSNHGNPEYTCLYRIRVHGKRP